MASELALKAMRIPTKKDKPVQHSQTAERGHAMHLKKEARTSGPRTRHGPIPVRMPKVDRMTAPRQGAAPPTLFLSPPIEPAWRSEGS